MGDQPSKEDVTQYLGQAEALRKIVEKIGTAAEEAHVATMVAEGSEMLKVIKEKDAEASKGMQINLSQRS